MRGIQKISTANITSLTGDNIYTALKAQKIADYRCFVGALNNNGAWVIIGFAYYEFTIVTAIINKAGNLYSYYHSSDGHNKLYHFTQLE